MGPGSKGPPGPASAELFTRTWLFMTWGNLKGFSTPAGLGRDPLPLSERHFLWQMTPGEREERGETAITPVTFRALSTSWSYTSKRLRNSVNRQTMS